MRFMEQDQILHDQSYRSDYQPGCWDEANTKCITGPEITRNSVWLRVQRVSMLSETVIWFLKDLSFRGLSEDLPFIPEAHGWGQGLEVIT